MPKQAYSGTAIEQIQQRYTNGIWGASVFDQKLIDRITQHWINDDAEFARQRLGGPNFDVIAQFTGSNDDLANWFNNSAGSHDNAALLTALQAANGTGTLFVCDYSIALGKVKTNPFVQKNFYFSVPVAYFSVVGDALMPLAIHVDSSDKGYIFTLQDDANSWLSAKLWAGSADILWWFVGAHFFNSHSIVMLFSIAALNQIQQNLIAEDHPIMTLVYPHLQKIFGINNIVYSVTGPAIPGATAPAGNPPGYGGIYQVGGFCDTSLPTGRIGGYQIINDLYQNYNFDEMAFDRNVANRKVDSGKLKISFPYRDDSQVWWQAIQTFVGNIVDATYANDAAVATDTQLNAWIPQHATNSNRVL